METYYSDMARRRVLTLLDFCWKSGGKEYNFPTLFFYQLGYSLFTVWQASRRAYRLIQRKECRVYYMAYEGTVQAAVISLIAQKQVATSAIQGKFSTEGIAAMAEGVDERVQLAAAMSEKDFSSRNSIQDMFDALAGDTEEEKADIEKEQRMKTLSELIGSDRAEALERKFRPSTEDIINDLFDDLFDTFEEFGENGEKEKKEEVKTSPEPKKEKKSEPASFQKAVGQNIFDFFDMF